MAKLDAATAEKLLDLDWFSDDLTDAEASKVAAISRISAGNPDLPSKLLDLEWVRDGLTGTDGLAVFRLAEMEPSWPA